MIEVLRSALADLGPEVTSRSEQLAAHWQLVKQWNDKTNLTAITNESDAAWLHYRDCLELLAVVGPGSIADMGSGAGYPGLPLAICGRSDMSACPYHVVWASSLSRHCFCRARCRATMCPVSDTKNKPAEVLEPRRVRRARLDLDHRHSLCRSEHLQHPRPQ